MVRGRRAFDAADIVILGAAALLAVLCGVGGGFVLWSVLSGIDAPPALREAIALAALVGGIALLFRRTVQIRFFLALAVLALLASFALGSTLWAPLLGR